MEQEDKKEEGKLPVNIDEIISKSLKTIDTISLTQWFCLMKLRIKVDDNGAYKYPNQGELKTIIIDSIKHYYNNDLTLTNFMIPVNVDENYHPRAGGFMMKKESDHFYIDFVLPTEEDLNRILGTSQAEDKEKKTIKMDHELLPKNIDEIIAASLKTIDITALRIWLKSKKVLIRVKNKTGYKLPTNKEIEDMITRTIKQYYFDQVTDSNYMFGENIDNNVHFCMGGVSLLKKDGYFEIDFDIMFPPDEKGNVLYTSYRKEIRGIALMN